MSGFSVVDIWTFFDFICESPSRPDGGASSKSKILRLTAYFPTESFGKPNRPFVPYESNTA